MLRANASVYLVLATNLHGESVSYLAPMTIVLPRRIASSITRYMIAGTVVNAAFLSVSARSGGNLSLYSRPKNNARVVNVPYSFSNRSISGVKATTLSTA
jgi:hypothetical protein